MSLKDKFKITIRGYKTIHAHVPGILPVMTAQAVFNALKPFVNIYMSARIVTALAAGEDLRQVLTLALLTAVLNMLANLISAGIERSNYYYFQKFWEVFELPLSEKIETMDYERVEDTAVHLKKEHIRALKNTNGLGLTKLIVSFSDLISGLFTTAFSVTLLSGAFTSHYAGAAGGWAVLFSPLSAAAVILLIALNIAGNLLFQQKSTKTIVKTIEEFVPANRMGNYYTSFLMNYKAGKDIKLYALKKPIQKEFYGFRTLTASVMGRLQKVMAKYDSLIALLNTVVTGVIYAYVAIKALLGSFGVGNIVQYVGSLTQLGGGVARVMENIMLLYLNTDALALFYEFTDMPDTKYHGTIPVEKRADNEYEIEFRDVSFKYPGTEHYVLKNLNLRLNIGQRLAIVGMNGSGKTTMIKLLCRLYDPTEGTITLNGIDIKKYEYNEYMSLFGVVFQDFKLFSFGLGQNVAARVDYDGERARRCLEKAGFNERLARMPKGLDTPLYKDFDEDGVEISGGEAQKIALARSIYKNAPFIVLDEPTAALDPIAEYEIYSHFDTIVGDRTAIYISHRLSSCRFCDDIAVFHEGRLIQRGSHETLLRDAGSKYYELWNAQAQYYTA